MQANPASTARAYLDCAATTPMRPEALEAFVRYSGALYGNPSGGHAIARTARDALDEAREEFARLVGAKPSEIVFTSGGTEADNLAIKGALRPGTIAACSAADHHAIIEPTRHIGGVALPVDENARLDKSKLVKFLQETVAGCAAKGLRLGVLSVILANNEVGSVNDIAAISKLVRKHAPGVRLHTDAVQAFGWLPVAEVTLMTDMVSYSAHKFGGPMGVGALVNRGRTKLIPQLHGGGQEYGTRSGTPNFPGIMAMIEAAKASDSNREADSIRVEAMTSALCKGILATVPDCRLNCRSVESKSIQGSGYSVDGSLQDSWLPSISNLRFDGVESEELLFMLDEMGVSASAGSSCSSGALEPSHVLMAAGLTKVEAGSSVRFSLGYATTEIEVEIALEAIAKAVAKLRDRRK